MWLFDTIIIIFNIFIIYLLFVGLTASSGIGEYVAELYCDLISDQVIDRKKFPLKSFQNDLLQSNIAEDGLLGISVCASSPLSLDEINQNLIIKKSSNNNKNNNNTPIINCPTVPPLEVLAKEFQENIKLTGKNPAEGSVTLYGRQHRVTHPIASFGLETYQLDSYSSPTKEVMK